MSTINLTKRDNGQENNTRLDDVGISDSIFRDMLEHIRPLLSKKEGTSEWQIKDHFRNLRAHVVEEFLSIAKKRGIIKETFGTYYVNLVRQ